MTFGIVQLSPRVPSSMSINGDVVMDHVIQSMKQVYNKGYDFHSELVNRVRREIEHGDLNEVDQKHFQSFVQKAERTLSSQSQGNGPSINIINANNVNNYLARQAGVGNTSEDEECEYGKMMGEVR